LNLRHLPVIIVVLIGIRKDLEVTDDEIAIAQTGPRDALRARRGPLWRRARASRWSAIALALAGAAAEPTPGPDPSATLAEDR